MLLTLSNPLHLAVVGNPHRPSRSPSKGKVMARHRRSARKSSHKARKTAKRSSHRFAKKGVKVRAKHIRRAGRKGSVTIRARRGKLVVRRNPAIVATVKSMLITPVTSLPARVPALFKGQMAKNVAFATGGAIVALVAGNQLQKVAMPFIAKIPGVSAAMGGGVVQRVIGASFTLLSGSVLGKIAVKDQASQNAFATGVAAAALIEAIFPGRIALLLSNVPVVGGLLAPAASPVNGLRGLFGTDDLAAYVDAPSYQGTGAYVDAPSYQGTGAYVEAPSYQGTGGLAGPNDAVAGMGYAGDQLAGNLEGMGSNMSSHLDS